MLAQTARRAVYLVPTWPPAPPPRALPGAPGPAPSAHTWPPRPPPSVTSPAASEAQLPLRVLDVLSDAALRGGRAGVRTGTRRSGRSRGTQAPGTVRPLPSPLSLSPHAPPFPFLSHSVLRCLRRLSGGVARGHPCRVGWRKAARPGHGWRSTQRGGPGGEASAAGHPGTPARPQGSRGQETCRSIPAHRAWGVCTVTTGSSPRELSCLRLTCHHSRG